MRLAALLAGLLTSACCTSLPKQTAKRVAFPSAPAAVSGLREESHVWHDAKRDRDVPVKLYVPATANGRHPVVLFSHGIGEDRESYAYMGRALAGAGFMAVHITHAGTDRAVLERGYLNLYREVKKVENWQARPLDVTFVLDQLAQRDDADLARVAVAGHSAGAFTAFAAAGIEMDRGNLRDERVKAIVAMSMPRLGDVVRDYNVTIPTLNLTGTCDTSIIYRTFPRHRRIPFEQSRGQVLVTLDRVNHDTFVVEDERNALIASIAIAFLRGYLLDDAAARAWFAEEGKAELVGVDLAVEVR
ncbi:MAG TPA: alpha/beta hydrolase [Thermoanaerobaculia bacterium]